MSKKRLNLALDDIAASRLSWLTDNTSNSTQTQTIQQALSLYYFIVKEEQKGNEILLKQADGTEKRLVFLS